ncbi:amidohydrolase family protein [Gemmatimonas groenlandica]|uniref:Amidohydrolase family protein n=1 Tax=Gemmatimonas groenlandica TaxID=2732249 RepID=A0A6M4IV83_9BACT|nr:amidohydrolase family protein [Gemmatimonas groenlandica]QJR37507.1 amidohydrolase family protein [Gemmatimonas groenlandica]
MIAARFRKSGESIPAIYAAFAAAVDTPDCHARLRRAAEAGLVLTPTLVATYMSHAEAKRLLGVLPANQRSGCDLYLRQFDGVSDVVRARILEAGRRLVGMVVAADVPLLAGTDAPTFCAAPGESLVLELQMLADGGLSPISVLQAATSLPARVFDAEERFGVLAVGRHADLVLLSENPLTTARAYVHPVGVYTQGYWYDAGALAALRQRQ